MGAIATGIEQIGEWVGRREEEVCGSSPRPKAACVEFVSWAASHRW